MTGCFIALAALFGIYHTFVFYPGVLYTDSYMRWETVLTHFQANPHMSLGPSLWMWIAYRLTNNFAAFTFAQSFALFASAFLLLQRLTQLRGALALVVATPVLLVPLFPGYSVFHESGVLASTAFAFLLVLSHSSLESRALRSRLVYYGLLFVCLFTIFTCRLNALTILPVLLYGFIKRRPRSKAIVGARLSVLVAAIVSARMLPSMLGTRTVDVGPLGVAWETLQIIKRTQNPAYDHYLDYAGNTKAAMADIEDSLWPSMVAPGGLHSLLDDDKPQRIFHDYLALAVKEPQAFLETKLHIIDRVMGISRPLGFYEFDEDRFGKIHEYGGRSTDARHEAITNVNAFMNRASLLSCPWAVFLVGAALLLVNRLFLNRPMRMLGPMLALAAFYYASFCITTQGYEVRYFFPSLSIVLLATLGVVARVAMELARVVWLCVATDLGGLGGLARRTTD